MSRLFQITLLAMAIGLPFVLPYSPVNIFTSTVFAEDDEDEDEDEEEDDEEEHKSSSKKSTATEMVTRTYTVIERVAQTVLVTPQEFLSDRDGDLIVDALDPDPDVHQREYFLDDDGDDVANVNDRYPGQDDFSVFDEETDENNNGIIDSYETVQP